MAPLKSAVQIQGGQIFNTVDAQADACVQKLFVVAFDLLQHDLSWKLRFLISDSMHAATSGFCTCSKRGTGTLGSISIPGCKSD